mgnify:CR=1 FL=1
MQATGERDVPRLRRGCGPPLSLLRLAVVMLVLGGCSRSVVADQTLRSPSGAILEPGELGTVHLRIGDCVRGPIPDVVDALYGVPCQRAHLAQVFAIGDGPETCVEMFDRALGSLAVRTDLPRVDLSALVVTEGRERVVCMLELAEPITEDLVRPQA